MTEKYNIKMLEACFYFKKVYSVEIEMSVHWTESQKKAHRLSQCAYVNKAFVI